MSCSRKGRLLFGDNRCNRPSRAVSPAGEALRFVRCLRGTTRTRSPPPERGDGASRRRAVVDETEVSSRGELQTSGARPEPAPPRSPLGALRGRTRKCLCRGTRKTLLSRLCSTIRCREDSFLRGLIDTSTLSDDRLHARR